MVKAILQRVILFIIFLTSGGANYVDSYLLSILALLFLSIIYIYEGKLYRKQNILIILCITILFFLANFFLTGMAGYQTYIVCLIYLIIAFLFISTYQYNQDLIKTMYSVLIFVLYFSIVSFFAQFLVKPYLIYDESLRALSFYKIFIYHEKPYFMDLLRVQGFFWEPGILQFYLNLLMFISLSYYKNVKIAVLAAFAIFTTYSSIGIVLLLLQALYFYFKYYAKFNVRSLFVFIAFSLTFVVGSLVMTSNLEDKLIGANAQSSYGRIYDAMTGIEIIKRHPMTGIGLDTEKYLKVQNQLSYMGTLLPDEAIKDRGSTNGIISFISQLGIFASLFFFYRLYFSNIILKDKVIFRLLLFVTLLVEPIMLSPFVFLIFIYGNVISRKSYAFPKVYQ